MKPKLFIGSSQEAIDVAHEFRHALEDVADCVLWKEAPEFEPNKGTLESLFNASNAYDFGLFILTPDDETKSRGDPSMAPRDNVIFELGLFLGKFDPDRVFIVREKPQKGQVKIKILSDLDGIFIPQFSTGDAHRRIASIGGRIKKFRDRIKKLQRRKKIFFKTYSWTCEPDEAMLWVELPVHEIDKYKSVLEGNGLVLIGRKYNTNINMMLDRRLARSKVRTIYGRETDSVRICAQNKRVLSGIKSGDRIEACLLFVPEGVKLVTKQQTIENYIDLGCDSLLHLGKIIN